MAQQETWTQCKITRWSWNFAVLVDFRYGMCRYHWKFSKAISIHPYYRWESTEGEREDLWSWWFACSKSAGTYVMLGGELWNTVCCPPVSVSLAALPRHVRWFASVDPPQALGYHKRSVFYRFYPALFKNRATELLRTLQVVLWKAWCSDKILSV